MNTLSSGYLSDQDSWCLRYQLHSNVHKLPLKDRHLSDQGYVGLFKTVREVSGIERCHYRVFSELYSSILLLPSPMVWRCLLPVVLECVANLLFPYPYHATLPCAVSSSAVVTNSIPPLHLRIYMH